MITYYLSGPMRGMSEHNYPAFFAVEKALSEQLDHVVTSEIINPANNFDGDKGRSTDEYMLTDLGAVLRADVLVLLPGWESSEGASREVQVATWTGKRFMLAQQYVEGSSEAWFFNNIDIPTPQLSPRAEALTGALQAITGDRNNQYGPPTQDFRRSADAMTAYGYRHTQLPASAPPCTACGARPLRSYDTAIAVDCVKTSRIMWTPEKLDHWLDKAGYAGCGYEAAVEEAKSA